MTHQDKTINYIELPLADGAKTKAFYGDAFGWTFIDYGPDYMSFQGAGIDGGFNGEASAAAEGVGTLTVLYAADLEATRDAVDKAGGIITKPIFSFPGGRRFHFLDPNGNELAVWSE
jgi:predicted enzyme related to lactoylglutathione lyase